MTKARRRELGLGQDHSGIWVLPDDAPVGQPMADFMGAGDTVLDLEITPGKANRAQLNRAPLKRTRDLLGALSIMRWLP